MNGLVKDLRLSAYDTPFLLVFLFNKTKLYGKHTCPFAVTAI